MTLRGWRMGLGKAAGRRAASTEPTQVDSGLQPLSQPRLQLGACGCSQTALVVHFFSWSHWLNPFIRKVRIRNRMFPFRVVNYNAESSGEENRTSFMSIWGSGLLPVQPTPPRISPRTTSEACKTLKGLGHLQAPGRTAYFLCTPLGSLRP